MAKWIVSALLVAVVVVGFAGEARARELNGGEKQVTAHHGGHRGGGHHGGWYRGGRRR